MKAAACVYMICRRRGRVMNLSRIAKTICLNLDTLNSTYLTMDTLFRSYLRDKRSYSNFTKVVSIFMKFWLCAGVYRKLTTYLYSKWLCRSNVWSTFRQPHYQYQQVPVFFFVTNSACSRLSYIEATEFLISIAQESCLDTGRHTAGLAVAAVVLVLQWKKIYEPQHAQTLLSHYILSQVSHVISVLKIRWLYFGERTNWNENCINVHVWYSSWQNYCITFFSYLI